MIYTVLGILSSIIFIVGDIPYLRDTLKRDTTPQRVTWGVVFLLNFIGFANQLAAGASNSLWLFGAAVVMTGLIFLASIRHGVGGHSRQDMIVLLIALSGVSLWIILDSPLVSILANVFAAIVALIPTFIKTKRDPDSETKITWLLGALSALLALISVGELNIELLLLPATGAVLQGYMVYLLYLAPRKTNQPAS